MIMGATVLRAYVFTDGLVTALAAARDWVCIYEYNVCVCVRVSRILLCSHFSRFFDVFSNGK